MGTRANTFDLEEVERGLFYGYMYWQNEARDSARSGDKSGFEVAQRIANKIEGQLSVVRVMAGKE